MTEHPTHGKRPWNAEPLRDYIQVRITGERVSHVGPATRAQVQSLVMALDEVYASRLDRLASLGWLLRRDIRSTNDITKAEASVLLSWLRNDPDASASEAERVLLACLKAQGQLTLDLDPPEESSDERTARLRDVFGDTE